MKAIALAVFSILLISGAAASNTNPDNSGNTDGKTGSSMMSDAGYMVVSSDSKLNWIGKKTGGEHHGSVIITEGNFQVSEGKMVAGDFIIDMTSISVEDLTSGVMNKKLVNHLKSEDFFNTESHPRAYFKMTEGKFVEGDDDQTDHYLVTGSLTIKDISHDISFNAYVNQDRSMIKTDEIVLDRTKWDVNYKSKSIFAGLADNYIHDEMYISIELAVIK